LAHFCTNCAKCVNCVTAKNTLFLASGSYPDTPHCAFLLHLCDLVAECESLVIIYIFLIYSLFINDTTMAHCTISNGIETITGALKKTTEHLVLWNSTNVGEPNSPTPIPTNSSCPSSVRSSLTSISKKRLRSQKKFHLSRILARTQGSFCIFRAYLREFNEFLIFNL
jgi:hypothetical protein